MIVTKMTGRLSQIQLNRNMTGTLFCNALPRYWVEDNDNIHVSPQPTSLVAGLTFERGIGRITF